MGIGLYWGNEDKTIILMEIDGPWEWDELHDKMEKVKELTNTADHEVSGILDVSQGMYIPGGTVFNKAGLDNAMKLLRTLNGATAGAMVIVGANRTIRNIFDAFVKLDRSAVSTVHFADSIDDAYDFLEDRQTALSA